MADQAAENEQVEDKAALAAFESGFSDPTPPAPKATAEDVKEPAKEGATEQVGADGKQKPEAKTETPAKSEPEFVQLSKTDYAKLMAAADKVVSIEGTQSKINGSVGNLHQLVKKLQEATPKGLTIDLPEDVVSELQKDFPELAGPFRSALVKALSGVKGTGEKGAEIDQSAVQKLVKDTVLQTHIEALEDDYPNWREIVGAPDEKGHIDPNNPYRKWLATQPEDYQAKINNAVSAAVVRKSIDKFNEFVAAQKKAAPALQKKPTPQTEGRRLRIETSIQPRGDGGPPAPRKTVQDSFEQGFNET